MESLQMERGKVDSALGKTRVAKTGGKGEVSQFGTKCTNIWKCTNACYHIIIWLASSGSVQCLSRLENPMGCCLRNQHWLVDCLSSAVFLIFSLEVFRHFFVWKLIWFLFYFSNYIWKGERVARSCLGAAVRFPSLNPILHSWLQCAQLSILYLALEQPNVASKM